MVLFGLLLQLPVHLLLCLWLSLSVMSGVFGFDQEMEPVSFHSCITVTVLVFLGHDDQPWLLQYLDP